MSSIPQEIYLGIFVKLSVKSIFVCKCVCKTWYLIISDPDSIMLPSYDGDCLCSISYDSLSSNDAISYDSLSSDDAIVIEMGFPWGTSNMAELKFIKLFGSCIGLFHGWNYSVKFHFLWNPATKESKRLQLPEKYFNCGDIRFRI